MMYVLKLHMDGTSHASRKRIDNRKALAEAASFQREVAGRASGQAQTRPRERGLLETIARASRGLL